ncbi:hypothetical protein KIN20_000820 [Parelaphostrongylus tenuis]|uniref:Timeless N-terminal domain-containing protein n=1 Tax=Parelaphostrongylus tenuis TaxID=148309 RepID=A0AAD5LW17_PARTN|nr:hypothetical protein KIN20_000820 [Parelaphostrongylus tenuis]
MMGHGPPAQIIPETERYISYRAVRRQTSFGYCSGNVRPRGKADRQPDVQTPPAGTVAQATARRAVKSLRRHARQPLERFLIAVELVIILTLYFSGSLMEAIIQATISALGFLENDVYYQEPDCYETIRDLIRFLRTDNSEMLARRICGERNIIGNDLIPIIKSENVKGKMFDITLRLLVNLTQPALVSLMGKHPESSEEWQKYWLLVENLKKAKPSFADTKFFTVLKLRLEMYFLETAWEDRVEEDRLVMERIIVLIRYIFDITNTGRHEEVAMEHTKGSDPHSITVGIERDFHLSILSIFALIIAEHNPSDIVVAGRQRTTAEKENAEEELRQVFMTEQARMAAQRRRILSNRHPRFYGSYVVKGLPAVNKKNDLPVYRPIKSLAEITYLDDRKKQKNRSQKSSTV